MDAVLITGANGLLGSTLQDTFKYHRLITPLYCSKSDLDITDTAQLEAYVTKHPVRYIINCAAYTDVQRAEQEVKACFEVNSIGAGNLATLSRKYNIPLIHISTDYVFGTTLGCPLKPNDPTEPVNQYGHSKLAGEKLITEIAEQYYIIRTSWLYHECGDNFFTRIIESGKKNETIQVPDDQIGSPTYVRDLAEAIGEVLKKISDNHIAYCPPGIYHYTNEGVASWYDFAHAILRKIPTSSTLVPVSSSQTDHVKRPYYSVLDKSSFREVFLREIRHWGHSMHSCFERWHAYDYMKRYR
ncbi:dTDP-4-dehydrorhamnose reductase [Cardinium endosymbiont of Culicoides punctatus]|uniref:dTDP-4-dehydrorhamnose reductase n=1 Tax=Cardinium endosymbiont of Culicoides punctatus TaxID=2304601 RepID=UPI001058BEC8|nr:dTDP-4-dehydrorhamnose reductase [Cardinium endosymbiont of Culicoides punctatus]TDG95165.1 dTDP-4-dehydrorhamnose reductase [Cardinium endosymbiont of Culicoides punctatus]